MLWHSVRWRSVPVRRVGGAGGRARVPLGRHSPDRLPDRRSGPVHGQAAQRADRRRDGRQGLPERGLGHRARHDRAAEDRRARHDAHQRRAAEQCRARDDRPGTAVPVPLRGAHARRARRAGRRRDPGRDGGAGHGRAGLLRQRRPLDVHRDQADQDPGRRRAHEDPRAAVGPVRGHGRGAGRQPDADAVRRGLHRAEDRHRRCRREQLPVLRVPRAISRPPSIIR